MRILSNLAVLPLINCKIFIKRLKECKMLQKIERKIGI